MDSKHTKATQPFFIRTRSAKKAPAKSIAKLSRASKNTSKKSSPKKDPYTSEYSAWQRGLVAEACAEKFYLSQNFEVLQKRYRTPFAEVDLIFRNLESQQLVMVEVKAVSSLSFLSMRLGEKQKRRLYRAHSYLCAQWKQSFELHLAYVSLDGEVLVLDDISC